MTHLFRSWPRWWRCAGTVSVCLLAIATLAAQQRPSQPSDRPAAGFRTGVEVVRLSVTARDASGQIVHDLKPEEFEVYEDGVRQEIGPVGHHETPISAVLLLDTSGSMAGDKMMHAKDGVINFVNALRRDDEALIVAFNDSVSALGQFGLDRRTIQRAVERLDAGTGTRLYDAVIEGARAIAEPGRNEKRAIVILSDGEDTASVAPLTDAIQAVRLAEVPVYSIAIEFGDADRSWRRAVDPLWRQLRGASEIGALNKLTDATGGWTFPIEAAKRCKEVCLKIADELRNQYLLGYYPTNAARDGQWRTNRVRSTRPGIELKTRVGYYAPRS